MKHVIHNFGPDSGIERDYRRWCYMADNVEANAGSGGAVFATDEDTGGSRHVPWVKLMEGANGTFNEVGSANPLPVTANLSATDNAVLDSIVTNTTGLAGTVSGSELQVDVVAALPTGSNTIGTVNLSATDNTVLDNIQTSVDTVAAAVSTEMQVDVVAALPAGTNAIGKLAANSGVDIGDVDITSIAAGANLIGDVGISGTRTSGGTEIFRSIDLDEGTLEIVSATAGQLYWIHAMNLAASVRFLKVYNAASGTIGTGTPVLTFPIATQGDTNGAGFMFAIPNGVAFSTGICVGASTGVADNDTGAPGANEVIVNIGFAN